MSEPGDAGAGLYGPSGEAPPLEARDLRKTFLSGDGNELRILRG